MIKARIYKPAKSVMQSGHSYCKNWVLDFENPAARSPEPLMGWTQSADTMSQVRLQFDTLEDAIQYAQAQGLAFTVTQPHQRKIKPRNYTDNFRYQPPAPDAKAAPKPKKKSPAKSKASPKSDKAEDAKKA